MRHNPDPSEETFEEAFRRALLGDSDLPPIPPGQVRPLTDPEAVARWFGTQTNLLFSFATISMT